MKLGDQVRVTFEGSEIFEDGEERIGEVVGLDPVLVGEYSVGPKTSIVFGPQSYKQVEPIDV